MTSYEHKIRNIYLGDNSWSPNEDTMLYVPMKEDLLDHSWKNVVLTNGWVSLDTSVANVWVWYFDWNSKINFPSSFFDMSTSDFTISFWCRDWAWLWSSHWSIFNNQWTKFSSLLLRYQWTQLYASTREGTWDMFNAVTAFDINQSKWILWTMTRQWSTWKIYKNNILNWSWTNSSSLNYNSSYTWVIWWHEVANPNYYIGHISEFIVEKKAREKQEITDYFKKTKIDYGYNPWDHQEVQYIESSWTQWIDTLVTPTSNTKSQIKFMNKAVTWDVIYGMYNNNDNADYRFFNYQSAIYRDLNSSRVYWSSCGANNIYEFEIWNNYVKNVWASSNLVSWSAVSGYTGSSTITLNKSNSWAVSQNRWYYVKIREWETMVRDLVPCYRRSDGAIGMYDKVNNVFYTNSWTWTFTKWPDV